MLETDRCVITDIDIVIRVNSHRDRPIIKEFGPRRYHGLVLQLSGETRYVVDEKHTFINKPGCLLYLEEGVPYRVYGSCDSDCIAVNFHLTSPSGSEAFLIQPRASGIWQDIFFDLLGEWEHIHPGHLARCRSILYRILAMLEEQRVDLSLPSARLNEVENVGRYLDAHLSEPDLSVEAAMATSALGKTYLRNLFVEVYGMTPRLYLTSIRIAHAKALLTATDKPVTEIAGLCGYDSLYSFSRSFSHETGTSPSAYRKEH